MGNEARQKVCTMTERQRSIKAAISVEGYGLHTGKSAKVTLKPAGADYGIKFSKNIDGQLKTMAADVSLVRFSERCTVLENDHFKVMTVEHLLSAIAGLKIYNIEIEIEGEELPILDGSALPWVKSLNQAGIDEQEAPVRFDKAQDSLSFTDEETGGIYSFVPSDHLEMSVAIDFGSEVVAPQYASWHESMSFETEIAPCRTFVFLHDVLPLLQYGLIKGGTLNNAILITEQSVDDEIVNQLRQNYPLQDESVLTKGIHGQGGLRFNNELARHKLLDLIGDMSLVNRPLKGKIFAIKPSHKGNTAFAKVLKKHLAEQAKMVFYNPNVPPVYTNEEIADMLPHRYPFLLVDKIIHLEENVVIGLKNVTFNENYFQGHFPNNPVMPGVLQIEALAQVGGVLALKHLPADKKYDTYFLKIDNAKFKKKVVPGDTLLLKMELMEPIRRGICKMQGTAFVANTVVAEAELTAQLVPRAV
jgi:UDP-3-O-[3-hydroxymyristoyl] N-acetylglucosamine deacetylase / 3-hydroxyacyl-[acyl-carrier-protein] dehydratase